MTQVGWANKVKYVADAFALILKELTLASCDFEEKCELGEDCKTWREMV